MSNFQTAAAAALPAFYETFGKPVTYSRDGEADITALDMILSEEEGTFEDVGGIIIPIKNRFGTIKQVDLDFGAGAVPPARGDTITTAAGEIFDLEGDDPGEKLNDTDEWKLSLSKAG